jgi:tetratricopeptide (TPR) repeat protein
MPKQKSFKYTGPTPPRHLINSIDQIESKMQAGDYESAGEILHDLEKKYRENPFLLTVAYNYYSETQNYYALEPVCRSLYAMDKRDPDIALAIATTYMMNSRPGMARKVFVDFLHRWPNHEDAAVARKTIVEIESTLRQETEPNLTDAQLFEELIVLHDEVCYALDHHLFHQGRRLAEQLLAKFPTFIPALNNLAQIYYLEGNLSKALQTSQGALEKSPENIHALANYARMLFIMGREADAMEIAKRLKQSEAPAADKWTKIAETLGFIGDDNGLLDLYSRVKAEKQLSEQYVSPLFYHLVAVIYANRGDEKEAKALWNKVLQLDPDFELALENLEDIRLPKHERNGSWAYTIQYWFPALRQEIETALGGSGKQAEKSVKNFINNHPEILRLAPILYQRGDPSARQFLIGLAGITGNESLTAAAKEFALGQKGSDKLRLEAAQMLSRNKTLPNGLVRMWIEGEWRELLLLGFEINDEPRTDLPKAAMDVYFQSHQALKNEDGAKAQIILEDVIKKFPNSPSLFNNLAVAYQIQGNLDKSRKMLDEVLERFPDYLFGIVARTRNEINNKNYAAAHELIHRAMQRESFHFSEFESLCAVQIDLLLLEGRADRAEQWLGIWEEMMPDSPAVKEYKGKASLQMLVASGKSWMRKQRKANKK